MKKKLTTVLIWIAAVIITGVFLFYQRTTGPTYPISGEVEIAGKEIEYKLPRSHGGDTDAPIEINIPDNTISGKLKWKRYPTDEPWTVIDMIQENNMLKAALPNQPPAGKVSYFISLYNDGNEFPLTEETVILRYKGEVPMWIVIAHVFFISFAFTLSVRSALEALANRNYVWKFSLLTVAFLIIGGFIFGPLMQKYAFDAYWTGWPFGTDLTDNKTAVALIMWLIALWRLKVRPEQKWWAVIAAVVLIAVYLIPHSMLGSQLDYTQIPQN